MKDSLSDYVKRKELAIEERSYQALIHELEEASTWRSINCPEDWNYISILLEKAANSMSELLQKAHSKRGEE